MTLENGMMLLCGLGLFLFGMKLMGDGLELTAGSRLKSLVERLTTNKYMGALIGLLVTAVIQSSSATTVMVVGFVNAGIMNLAQAVGVIMGANIGTTVTSFLIAIKLNALAPLAIFIGVILMQFSQKVNRRHVGQIITGFGVLVAVVSFLGVLWAVIEAILGSTVSGWASMTSIICFVSGVQLICLGVIGEYIGKIYMETKARPRYIISDRTWNQNSDQKNESKKP